ncbi:MAG: hypothetical protein QX203_07205, partial [Methylococcaceae bacterium]
MGTDSHPTGLVINTAYCPVFCKTLMSDMGQVAVFAFAFEHPPYLGKRGRRTAPALPCESLIALAVAGFEAIRYKPLLGNLNGTF